MEIKTLEVADVLKTLNEITREPACKDGSCERCYLDVLLNKKSAATRNLVGLAAACFLHSGKLDEVGHLLTTGFLLGWKLRGVAELEKLSRL